MDFSLSDEQQLLVKDIRLFTEKYIMPYADEYDRQENTPDECLKLLGQKGILGAVIPKEYGGMGLNTDSVSYGLLCQELGRAGASLLSLITAHGMVCIAIMKWGSPEQREHWLPRLASGETIGAFGLTEPDIGSHASGVETAVTETDNGFVINGHKKWISFAQKAGLFLVIGKWNKTPSAFLIERERPGVRVKPMGGLLGFRSAMLGEVILENCEIPASSIVGGVSVGSGFGFSHVATSALDLGRLSVAWGCLGLAESCLKESLSYSGKRQQGKFKLSKYQLIQEMLAEMVTNIQATRALCYHASWLRDKGDPNAIMEICIAKYFASRMVGKCASDTLQIHGANGCGPDYPVQRYWRDARIMEIIEGSTQIQQLLISRYGFQNSDA